MSSHSACDTFDSSYNYTKLQKNDLGLRGNRSNLFLTKINMRMPQAIEEVMHVLFEVTLVNYVVPG